MQIVNRQPQDASLEHHREAANPVVTKRVGFKSQLINPNS